MADRGTWISFKNRGDLEIAVEGDKRLFNQYGVMLVNPKKYPSVNKELGQTFVDWLVSPEGQAAITGYKIDGQQLFFSDAEKKGAWASAFVLAKEVFFRDHIFIVVPANAGTHTPWTRGLGT